MNIGNAGNALRFGAVTYDQLGVGPAQYNKEPFKLYTFQTSEEDITAFQELAYVGPEQYPTAVQLSIDPYEGVSVVRTAKEFFNFKPIKSKPRLELLARFIERLAQSDTSKDGKMAVQDLFKALALSVYRASGLEKANKALLDTLPAES